MVDISRRDFLRALAASALLPIVSHVPVGEAADNSPNILIVVADTLVARHMSLYGYQLDNTPHFNRWAERATVFHNHYAGANFTSPATASLLTGTLPWTHRAFNIRGRADRAMIDLNIFQQFATAGYHTFGFAQNTLAAILLSEMAGSIDDLAPFDQWHLHNNRFSQQFLRLPDNDYQLKVITDNELVGTDNQSLYLSFLSRLWEVWQTRRSLAEEKDVYPFGYPQFTKGSCSFRLDEVMDGVTETLFNLPKPYLAYVHLWPPHEPYRPTKTFYDRFKTEMMDVPARPETPFDASRPLQFIKREQNYYDAFIANVDFEFGRMMDRLKQAGELENTWVVFTSDHGELFSNGLVRHTTPLLSNDLVNIPLVVFPPDATERRDVFQVTSCIDLIPTLLNVIGETADERHEGRLLPGLGGDETADHPAFAMETKRLHHSAPFTDVTSLTMRQGQYKLEQYIGYEGIDDFHRLFDLANDPLELNDIADSQKGVAADLLALLHDHVAPYQ